jgi:hypothetical protein
MDDHEQRPVVGYEGLYTITRSGQIYSASREGFGKPGEAGDPSRRMKTTSLNNMGYWRTILWKAGKMRNHLVHRLVAQAFIPNPEGKAEVNHIDSDPANCHVSNLEWTTHRENMEHASKAGRLRGSRGPVGSAHPRAKLSEDKVRDARRRHGRGTVTVRALSVEHAVNRSTVRAALLGRTWAHVEQEPVS